MTDLTKWPRLLVVGDPVATEQANEILVRTDDWYFGTNDRVWEQQLTALAIEFGRPAQPPRHSDSQQHMATLREHWQTEDDWKRRLGILELSYLNNDRIASAWIGGPHGWCDWNGFIGCSTYNIGKWPTIEEVTEDWTAIAQAFPYLSLRAQLVPDEGEADAPAVEWKVSAGTVETVEPTRLLLPPAEFDASMLGGLFDSGRERGVPLERLREALTQVAGTVTS